MTAVMEILSLENSGVNQDMVMVENIWLQVKKNTLGSMIEAAETGTASINYNLEKFISGSSNKIKSKDMDSANI